MVFVQEANSQVRLQQTLFLIVNSDLILRREDQEMELLLTLDIVLMILGGYGDNILFTSKLIAGVQVREGTSFFSLGPLCFLVPLSI